MTPAASAEDLTFSFETYNAETNIVLVATVTGITTSMSEIDVALEIENQLTDLLPAYSGVPVFSTDAYEATFRVTRTSHSVCVWSQAQFRTQLTENNTGAKLKISPTPVLMTVARANALNGGFTGSAFGTLSGTALTTDQTIDMLESVSAELIGYLNNNIVISTYLGEFRTDGYKSIFTSPTPGVAIDTPTVRRKYAYEIWAIPQYGYLAYNWIRHSGQLNFRYNENFVNAGEPFELDNEVRVTFTAGEFDIPVAIEKCLIHLTQLGINMSSGVEELAGGSFKVKFGDYSKTLEHIFRPIRKYKMKKMR